MGPAVRLPKLFIGAYQPLERPTFPVDDELVSKQIREAEKHPVNGIKPVLILENEDTWTEPLFCDEYPIG
jgi:hypothetical protein